MNQSHCQIQEIGSDSMVLDLTVSVSFLLQAIEFHRISHMGNFKVLVGCILEYISLGSIFVTDEDHCLALWH